jgi:hypothetical protein
MNLPIELINKILIMRPTHPTAKLIKQMFIDTNKHIDEWFSFNRENPMNKPRTPNSFIFNDFHRFYFHYNKYGLYSNTQKFYKFKITDFC